MEVMRRMAKAFLVAGFCCAPFAPAVASCDERIAGSCPPAPRIESPPAAEPVTVDRARPARTRSSTRRRGSIVRSSSSSRRQARARARHQWREVEAEEDVAIPMPPVRPRAMRTETSAVSTPPASPVGVPWQTSDGAPLMAYEATQLAPRPPASDRVPQSAPPFGSNAASPNAAALVPSSPVAQARAATRPPPAPSPPAPSGAAAVTASIAPPVHASAAPPPGESASLSMLRAFFIGLGGLLVLGTIVRLAFG